MLAGPQKAFATMLITTLAGIVAVLILQLPDNPDVQLWGGIITGVLAVLANTLGVYYTTNKGAAKADDIDPAEGLE